MQRNPSHFGSYAHWSPTGISRASLASIGETGGFTLSVTSALRLDDASATASARGISSRSPVARILRSTMPLAMPFVADDDLHRHADEVGVGELHAGPHLPVVEEHVEPGRLAARR